jgi:hypothetical protein
VNPPPLPDRKRFPWIFYWIVLALIAIVAFVPVGSVVACGLIANTHGCRVDEGSVHPCVIGGKEYGQLLYTLGVTGWLMLVTLPAGALASPVKAVAATNRWIAISERDVRSGAKGAFIFSIALGEADPPTLLFCAAADVFVPWLIVLVLHRSAWRKRTANPAT